MDYYKTNSKDFNKGKIPVEIFKTNEDLFMDMAVDMIKEVQKNNMQDKKTVFICPVGPVGQYKYFVKMVNELEISLKKLYIFNMDEYMMDENTLIDSTHPLSFKGFMEREVYSKIRDDLNVEKENRYFPEPGNEDFTWNKIQELGGVDVAYGGVGINGHIAFNEPPKEELSVEKFSNVGTRVLQMSDETFYINCASGYDGALELMPRWCVTIGMKEILSAKKIRLYMFRNWHRSVIRRAIFSDTTCSFPVTLIQNHKDSCIKISEFVAEELLK